MRTTLQPSYLDDRTRHAPGIPRYALHFFALVIGDGLHSLGEIVAEGHNEVTYRFALPDNKEHNLAAEFPELSGVCFVDLTVTDGDRIEKVELTPYFGVYVENGPGRPRLVLVGYKTPEAAFEAVKTLQTEPNFAKGLFLGGKPWVASMLDPETALTEA